jgi:hypothetical protein
MSTPPTKGTTLSHGHQRTIDKSACASAGPHQRKNNQIGQSNGSYFLPPATPVVDLLSRNYSVDTQRQGTKAQRRKGKLALQLLVASH